MFQAFFAPFAVILILASGGAAYADTAAPRCFDFSKEIIRPLRSMTPTVQFESGKLKSIEGGVWGFASGSIAASLNKVLSIIFNPQNTRHSRVDEMTVETFSPTHYKTHSVVKAFPLVTVEWDTEWMYSVLQGPADEPTQVLLSYEKTSGTSHIEHLCGNIYLDQTQEATIVSMYEEIKATGRSERDTLEGLLGTFSRIRSKVQPQ